MAIKDIYYRQDMINTIKLLSRQEKAKELNISERTFDRWVRTGKIKAIHLPNSKRLWFMPKKNNYLIYIKSHTEAPDYEDDTFAYNIDEATEIFAMRIAQHGEGWDSQELKKHVVQEI